MTTAFPVYAPANDDLPPGGGLSAGDIQGFWRPPPGGRVEIRACGEQICGFVNDVEPDPDPTHEGYMILNNFAYQGALKWDDGTIHNPEDGKVYQSQLELLRRNELKVTGCLWIFCQSQIWIRVN